MPRSLSHSALETFDQCPCKFKFHYIDRIDAKTGVAAEIFLGQAAHSALKEVYEARQFDKVLPLEHVLNTYNQVWLSLKADEIRISKEYMTVQDYITLGEKWLTEYYEKNKPFDTARVLSVERTHSAHIPNSESTLKGKIDLLLQRPDGTLEIVDFKTSREMPPNPRHNEFRKQMGLYLHLVLSNYTELTNGTPVLLTQYYLRHSMQLSYQMPAEELEELLEEVRQMAREISEAEKHETYPAKETDKCSWCDFQPLCPAKRHQYILKEEAGEAGGEEKSTYESASKLAEEYLQVDAQVKELKAKQDALKQVIIRMAQDLNLQRMWGKSGSVQIQIKHETKFPTKTHGPKEFAALSHMLRTWQYDEVFDLNANELAKLYKAERFSPEQLAQLSEFAYDQVSPRVSTRRSKDDDGE